MRKLCALLAAALLLLGLTACGTSATSQEKLDTLIADLATAKATAAEKDEQIAELNARIDELTQSVATTEKEAEKAQQALDEVNVKYEEVVAELDAAKTQISASTAPAPTPAPQQANTPVQEQPVAVQAEAPAPATTGGDVWIPNSGSKYHSHAGCSNMKNPTQTTMENAIAMGFGRCKKCW